MSFRDDMEIYSAAASDLRHKLGRFSLVLRARKPGLPAGGRTIGEIIKEINSVRKDLHDVEEKLYDLSQELPR